MSVETLAIPPLPPQPPLTPLCFSPPLTTHPHGHWFFQSHLLLTFEFPDASSLRFDLGNCQLRAEMAFPICSKSHFEEQGGKLGLSYFPCWMCLRLQKPITEAQLRENKMYLVTGKVQEHGISSRTCVAASFTNEWVSYTLRLLQISHLQGSMDGENRNKSNGQAASVLLRVTSAGTQHFIFVRFFPLLVHSIGSPHILLGSNSLVTLQDQLPPAHFLC